MEPHATRIVVWDTPPAVECGAAFKLKVGVKCAEQCGATAQRIEIRDEQGSSVASVAVGEARLTGTAALHYVELELNAPAAAGLHAWEARAVEVVDAPTGRITHAAASTGFRVRTVHAPECVLTVLAVDARSRLPVPGAKVVVHPYHARTNLEGIAELKLPKGVYRLFVTGRDRFPFRADGELDGDVTVRAELEADFGPSDAELWS